MRHAYTLIELLAVLIILGFVGLVGVPAVIRLAKGDPLQDAATALRTFDATARSIARDGPVTVLCDDRGMTIEGHAAGGRALPVRLSLPESLFVRWSDAAGAPLRELALDGRGRSVDALVVVGDGQRELLLKVLGLTGEWVGEHSREN